MKKKNIDLPKVSFEACSRKYLLFEDRVYWVGTMSPLDFDRMVQSHAAASQQAGILFDRIDRKTWDPFSRWYALNELVHMQKIRLFDSQEEALASLSDNQQGERSIP
jgi:hypothetical protein